MDVKKYLSDYSEEADLYLSNYFSQKRKEASGIDPLTVNVLNTLENFIQGGKKVRGALTVLGYKMVGGKKIDDILPVSCAIEIMHSSLLIHDDFIDHDNFRRGKPTVHRIYAKENSEHYGASIALIIGDVGIFLSNQILADSSFNPKLIIRAFHEYEDLLVNTGYGEILDIAFDKKTSISWDDILKIRKYKTAHYTFVMPLTVGAVLGGADSRVLSGIKNYGEPIGIGFQIRDDILGVFGDPKVTGKSNESDIKDGKRTFLSTKAMELVSSSDKEFLKKYYGSKGLRKKEVIKIKNIIKTSGALEYSQNLALNLAEKGKKYIHKVSKDEGSQKILAEFANFVVTRDK
ncbi:MAG: Polyprenyl synthetase superfamily [Candidatus Woesebacteria bacterium GW2011_GWB1_39_12]|uniref:Polyprenyl synthetase superfamily n=2 Tax=Candidatus Woeseibacteriota TaxID=1752722 RepID=A0A0G0M3I7_9BACT|nr:MAG: Polyprenyl synthetase superfamily [Candidatus Woesebacteria bacterium GW2011_GWA1_39_12]KKQ99293.1 MAG: Polyprenyl synthetase superfamily [Candidatus Woesebacteria bacterium GW2011_GWB1_39_12]